MRPLRVELNAHSNIDQWQGESSAPGQSFKSRPFPRRLGPKTKRGDHLRGGIDSRHAGADEQAIQRHPLPAGEIRNFGLGVGAVYALSGVGLVVLLVIIGVEVFLVRSMIGQPPGLNLYVVALLFVLSLPLLVLWLYWYYGLATLRYTMDRNALVIACGASRYVVPMEEIRRTVRGDEVSILQGFRGVGWPGYLMGSLRLRDLGLLLVASTELSDGIFDQTVVLVLDADESGSLGVVLNREATIDLRSALPAWAPLVSEPRVLFEDRFDGKLGHGWTWLREDAKTWRFCDADRTPLPTTSH